MTDSILLADLLEVDGVRGEHQDAGICDSQQIEMCGENVVEAQVVVVVYIVCE